MMFCQLLKLTGKNRKPINKSVCRRCLDKNWLKECECGCGGIIFKKDKQGAIIRFIYQHHMNLPEYKHSLKGQDHQSWKGGRVKIGNYWALLIPDYFSAQSNGYTYEHVYFYQEYHKVCVLPWAVVHHIEPVTETYCNNMPWNLETMIRTDHIIFHQRGKPRKKKDTTNQFCKYCNGKTYMRNGYEHWFGNRIDGYVCETCYQRAEK